MSATGDRHGAGSRGFTLIEMLVALAIAALIAGLGFPRLQSQIAAQEARTSIAAVTALLRTARARAVRTGLTTIVTANAGNSLQQEGLPPLTLPAAVAISTTGPLLFFGDGSANGGEITIAAGPRRTRIAISAATGLTLARASTP